MNKVLMFSLSLAAVLAGPVHAQVCSGGNDGGMDATGNQCNTPNEVANRFSDHPADANRQNGQRSGHCSQAYIADQHQSSFSDLRECAGLVGEVTPDGPSKAPERNRNRAARRVSPRERWGFLSSSPTLLRLISSEGFEVRVLPK